ncbi:MAG: B12-binding domain-containing protein [Spirochaetia bacterium]
MSVFEEISHSVQSGAARAVKELVEKAIAEGSSAKDILEKGLMPAMEIIGEKFKNNDIFVPEVLVASRAMNVGAAVLKP